MITRYPDGRYEISVADAHRINLQSNNVRFCGERVIEIIPTYQAGFIVRTDKNKYFQVSRWVALELVGDIDNGTKISNANDAGSTRTPW